MTPPGWRFIKWEMSGLWSRMEPWNWLTSNTYFLGATPSWENPAQENSSTSKLRICLMGAKSRKLKNLLGNILDIIGFSHGVIVQYRHPCGLEFLGLCDAPLHPDLPYLGIGLTGLHRMDQVLWQVHPKYLWQKLQVAFY